MRQTKGMIDISHKNITTRTAVARGVVELGEEIFKFLIAGKCPKGDVLATARIAAINATKQTPFLIPMCHPIPIESVEVDIVADESKWEVMVNVSAKSSAKTGVEMEAMTAVSIACLTIYDMLKGFPFGCTEAKNIRGQQIVIKDIKLLKKTGGKSGEFKRPN